jgi:DNA adenine methylase
MKNALIHYHGGKFRLADCIISFFPPHKLYVEPFGGAASVLLRKSVVQTEIYNDIDNRLFRVFNTIRNHPAELAAVLAMTLYSKKDLHLCYLADDYDKIDDIEFSRRFIVMGHLAISSTSMNEMTGFRSHVNSSIRSAVTGSGDYCSQANTFSKLPAAVFEIRDRLAKVIIENCDYRSLIDRYNRPAVLWYFDPPYLPSTRGKSSNKRGYHFSLTKDEHIELLEIIKGLNGFVVISGYDNEIYNEKLSDWNKVTKKTICDSRAKRIECLWMNYNIQQKLF